MYGENLQKTVLVVGGEKAFLEQASSVLEQAGYRVLTQERLTGCLTRVILEQPDLLLLDVNLTKTGGDTVVTVLRSANVRSGMVALLHGSWHSHELRARAREVGADGCLMNSSDEAELMRVVGDWLKPQATLAANATSSHSNLRAALPGATFPPVQITETSELAASGDPVRRVSGVQQLQRTVLFVDDDMFILSAYRRNFQSDDFVSEFSLSGVQALNRIRSSRPPDVLVCDVLMPNIDGGAVYAEAIALDPTWRRRTVLVSGALDAGLLPPNLSHFHGEVFVKPFNIDGLRAAIRRCLVFADGPAQLAAPRR